MEFTIYSIGDAVFLSEIINSVAMIAGTGNIQMLAMIGAILGVVIIMVQSLFQGATQINFQHLLLGWIIYAAMFAPQTTVLIEDVYSGTVHVVDNAPLGVGVAGGIISKVGYGITELFEQGFGAIEAGQTKRRYMEAMEILNELQRNGNDSSIFTAWNYSVGSGADLRLSWQNYIRECSLLNVDTGVYTVDQMMKMPIMEAMKFESSIYGTRLYLADGSGQDMTCSEGFAALSEATANIESNENIKYAVNRILGYSPETNPGEPEPLEKTRRALQSLGAVQTSAFDFLRTAVLEPVYMEAVGGRYQDVRDYSSAIMLNQAIQQRNIQWASEQSMFMTVARPLMTFFEGFIYAVTPVLALLIMLGGFGLQLAVKYMQSLLWIQLWMPTLAITNLYIHSSVSYEMASKLNAGGEPLNSMYALDSAADILSNWIAVGGMLAAATPIISLFFVTGSTYAFTSLAQRIGGSDHVDEKTMAPDVTKSGAYVQGAPAYGNDQVQGMMAAGSDELVSSTSFGSQLASQVSSASAVQKQKSEAFTEAFGKAYSSATSSQQMFNQSKALGKALESSNDESVQALAGHVRNFAESNDLSDDNRHSLLGSIAAGFSGFKGNAKIGTGIDTASGRSISHKEVTSLADSAGFSDADKQSIVDSVASTTTDTSSNSSTYGLSDTDSENLSRSSADLISSSKTYSQLDSLQQTSGSTLSATARFIGSQIVGSDKATKEFSNGWRDIATPKAKQEANAHGERLKYFGVPDELADTTAQVTALQNPRNFAPEQIAGAYSLVAKSAGIALGRNMGVDTDPTEHSGMSGPSHDAQANVEAGLGTTERIDSGKHQQRASRNVGGRDEPRAHYEKGLGKVEAASANKDQEVKSGDTQRTKQKIIDGGSLSHSGNKVAGGIQQALKSAFKWAPEVVSAYTSPEAMEYLKKGDFGDWENEAQFDLMQQVDNFEMDVKNHAITNYDLTDNQASLFAANILNGRDSSSAEHIANKELQLSGDYAHSFDDTVYRRPQLTPENKALVGAMSSKIAEAAHMGPTAAGSVLSDIRRLNMLQKPLK